MAPEKGAYGEGSKTKEGWVLYREGSIEQELFVPPVGKARLAITAAGTKVNGRGPGFMVFLDGRLILDGEIASEHWTTLEKEIEIMPGESRLRIRFINDAIDPVQREDRNLKLEKISMSWVRS